MELECNIIGLNFYGMVGRSSLLKQMGAIEHHRKSICILVSDAHLELCIDRRVNICLE